MTTPPISILKAVLSPYGARLKERRKREEPRLGFLPYTHSVYTWDEEKKCLVLKDSDTNPTRRYDSDYGSYGAWGLIDSDYFSWYGSMNKQSSWSACRCCKLICWGPEQRVAHQKASDCRHFLWEAFKFLRKTKRCVVCGVKTRITKHGVYLCDVDCLDIWKHEENTGRAVLLGALQQAGWKGDR